MVFNQAAVGEGGCRFYLSYSGSAPTGANCTSLATSVQSAWGTNLKTQTTSNFVLNEVDVLDIATNSGLSGQWTGTVAGTAGGTPLPVNCATNIEFGIARRYRGGKPRMFLPPGNAASTANQNSWTSAYITATNTGVTAFFAALAALSIGSMGTLQHVNLSYYHGFTNITNSSGRERAVPTYRATALHDNITGYSTKTIIGSQKRRRTSTTP